MEVKSTLRCLFVAWLVILMTACASVTQEEFASADFGDFPQNYENDIKNYMSRLLKDPHSAQYSFDTPRKGMSQDGWAVGNKKHFGYIVKTNINAKNSFGGYTGAKSYYFLFTKGLVTNVSQLYSVGRVKFYE